MDDKPRCQSCGMPLGDGFYGSNADGSESQEYCKFCFQDGVFTDEGLTVDDMIEKSADHMTKEQGFEAREARDLATGVIPSLKRWKKIN
jgi:hypothetical protein